MREEEKKERRRTGRLVRGKGKRGGQSRSLDKWKSGGRRVEGVKEERRRRRRNKD